MGTALSGPTTADLIAAATEQGHEVNPRLLELWRYRGLLPRPQRQPGGRAIWCYPDGSERWLARLLHWRDRTPSHREILVALWVEGFPIELHRVRGTLIDFVAKWSEMIKRETATTASRSSERALVDGLARKLARMRGKGAPFPRRVRMKLRDRERAFGYITAAMFGLEEELECRRADISHLERMLGIRTGREGGLSPTLGLVDPDGNAVQLPTPAQALDAVTKATPKELELVRRLVQIVIGWLPILLPILFAELGAKSVHLIDLIHDLFSDPPPAALTFLVTVLLVLLHSQEPSTEELEKHLQALDPELVMKGLSQLS